VWQWREQRGPGMVIALSIGLVTGAAAAAGAASSGFCTSCGGVGSTNCADESPGSAIGDAKKVMQISTFFLITAVPSLSFVPEVLIAVKGDFKTKAGVRQALSLGKFTFGLQIEPRIQ